MARTGRPKQEITKNKTVSLRMNEEQYERLKVYADKLGVSITDAIMSSVEKRTGSRLRAASFMHSSNTTRKS